MSHSYFSAPTFSPDLFYVGYVSQSTMYLRELKKIFVKIALMLQKLFGPKVQQEKKEMSKKRREKRGPLLFSLSSKKRSATPISLLLIKRSGTPPSLPILGVALGSGAQKSAAL